MVWTELRFITAKFSGIRKFRNATVFEPCREKTSFLRIQNKGPDQLRGNHEADQPLCFRFMDNTITLLPKSEISSL